LFATVSKGFKSGGINTFATTGEVFDPETLWSYEAGLKADFLDRRLRTNLTVFHYDYSNMQVQQTDGFNVFAVRNAGKARINGAELELTVAPTGGFQLGGNISYLDAEFVDFRTIDPANPGAGVQQFAGNRLPRAPKWSAFIFSQYYKKFSNNSSLTARIEYGWRDSVFFSAYENPLVRQGSFGLINSTIQYTFPGDRFTIGAWGRNIGATRYYQFIASSPGLTGVSAYPGAPRTFGATFGVRF
jgi:iron complex outermembrane recepter protein